MKKLFKKVVLLTSLLLSGFSGIMAGALQTNNPLSFKASNGEKLEFIGAAIFPDIGIYTFEANAEEPTSIIVEGDNYYANKGAIFANGKFFCVAEFDLIGTGSDNGVFTYATLFDTKTWKAIKKIEKPSKNLYAYCMAQDPTTNIIYGCFQNENGDGWELGTIDIEKMERTGVIYTFKSDEDRYLSMSFSSTGQLYGIGRENASLYKVDKQTGARETVGETGLQTPYLSSGEIDQRTNKYYYVEHRMLGSDLYEIDLETAEATELGEFPHYQIMGLHIMAPEAENDAPAAPTDLALNFATKALTGTISFKCPTTTFDGTTASGNLTYKVEGNGSELASGSTAYGKTETVNITVPKAGTYLFRVTLSNGKNSPTGEIEKWIGQDAPSMPQNIVAKRTGNKNIIQWDSVKEWEHGGRIEEAVTYTVVRYPGETEVAKNLTVCTVEDAFDSENLLAVSYGVRASATVTGAESRSNTLVLGSTTPPFAETFASKDDFLLFTTFDGDKDGKCWQHNAKDSTASSEGNKKKTANDWLFTPPLVMKAGHQYRLTFEASSENPFDPATLEVRFGNAATPEAMTTTVSEAVRMAFMGTKKYSTNVTATQDGIYHFGFHSISAAGMTAAILHEIEIERGINLLAPAQVKLNVTPDPDGKPAATFHIQAPRLTVDSSDLTEITKISCLMDGKTVKDIDNPKPGQNYDVPVSDSKEGYHDFSFLIYNSHGEGMPLESRIFLGVNLPGIPENIFVTELENNSGTVQLSWNAVTKDVDGYAFNPKFATYTIYCSAEENPIATNLTDTTFEYKAVEENEQAFVKFYVEASSKAGSNPDAGESATIAIGDPYVLPFCESFKGGKPSYQFMTNGYGEWQTSATYGYPNKPGCIVYVAQFQGAYSTLYTGKISLVNANEPHFSFAYSASPDNPNYIDVSVLDLTSHETTKFERVDMNAANWSKKEFDLTAFAGKNIMIGLTAYYEDQSIYTMIDEIEVFDVKPSGIETIGREEEAFNIRNFPGGIEIVSYGNASIQLYDMAGVLMASGHGTLTKQLLSGIYVARIGNKSVKVLVL